MANKPFLYYNSPYDVTYSDGLAYRNIAQNVKYKHFVYGKIGKNSWCRHYVSYPSTGLHGYNPGFNRYSTVINHCYDCEAAWGTVVRCFELQHGSFPDISLNWDKLPSSNQFNIIMMLAELDETLAMFSKKFVESLFKYEGLAAWQYGIMPLVTDIISIGNIVSNINQAILQKSFPYEDVSTYTVDYSGKDRISARGTLTLRCTGAVSPIGSTLPELLDVVGFHPDISTFWDLVPMSFVVNWFLPVGKWLDAIFQRGWTSETTFVGWKTLKFDGNVCISGDPISFPHGRITAFERSLLTGYPLQKVPTHPAKENHFNLLNPTFAQWLNTLYLLMLQKLQKQQLARAYRIPKLKGKRK